MAIYHLSMKPISRSSGRSAVAAAAYRSGTRLTNERDGLVHDYTRKSGIEHSEIVLPDGVNAEWAMDREALWNAAEFAEVRKDARVAREFEVALPHELTGEQRLELTREFSQSLANRFGTAVDFSIHSPDDATDVRNHHAHILMTTRTVGEHGLADKTDIERDNKYLAAHDMTSSHDQLKAIRLSWEELANQHLARAGHDVRIDHRSHEDRGLEIEPTVHVGVHATQMDRRGLEVERQRLDQEAAQRNADLIRAKPEQLLSIITNEKSVFDKRDVARTLHRYINDDPAEYQALLTRIMASDELVKLQEGSDRSGGFGDRQEGSGDGQRYGQGHPDGLQGPGDGGRAIYSTREMVDLEAGMSQSAERLQQSGSHAVADRHVASAIATHDRAIQRGVAADMAHHVERGMLTSAERERRIRSAGLSDEQRHAVEHITGGEGIALVVGYAGAGKSTMLAAAREAWEAEGKRVYGAALAGKAAEGLEESSGIMSRTLASWDYRLKLGSASFGKGDVLVIDEAGMVGSKQLAGFVSEIERAGAKLVLVGDHEQLQAIGAGAPFRALAEQVGFAALEDIRRQKQDWQRDASVKLASQRTGEALERYRDHGAVHLEENTDRARAALVRDYLADREQSPNGSRIAMAHRRVDVAALNVDIRQALKDSGHLPAGERAMGDRAGVNRLPGDADAAEVSYSTTGGVRAFTAGDRIVFLENDAKLGVKNGMLGTVERAEQGRLVTKIDGRNESLTVDTTAYKAFDHGYATTIHKTQGATVDKAFVMASATMDRHLTYVAMTRHKDDARLYAGQDEFGDMDGLKAKLGRARLKETTLDYSKVKEGQFAARRGMPDLHSDIVYPLEAQQRDAKHAGLEIDGRGETYRSGVGLAPHRDDLGGQGQHGKTDFAQNVEPDNNPRAVSQQRQMTQGKALPEPERPAGDVAEPAVAKPKRSIFAGLKLKVTPDRESMVHKEMGSSSERASDSRGSAGRDRLSERLRPASDIEQAVDRFARGYAAQLRMQAQGLPVLEGQRTELRSASEQLEKAKPGSVRLMASALQHDPQARQAVTDLTGRERVAELIQRMDQERKALADPHIRADRAVAAWRALEHQRSGLDDRQPSEGRDRVEAGMRKLAEGIGRDPQVESLLRNRTRELGLDRLGPGQHIAQEMERQIQRTRQRDRDRDMER